ncbi:MAG: TRAP transporter substrate-binding protein [Saprospiraceae bacterium]|nr:TRAP transporter substrate-binding protein [Saprospiraceae bacterium]MCF8252019.1 TRAP transporter substrate-binding protein [Saprospiraceae bacterium]MCF8281708.1 TRAP transporter substrate-binding protein [Bacteroidales bacterium]MCF8313696.1 TRAP transporter substrate-binding protein [Saprospiraceae bacterium]MCF8442403.1 TRAP transporter substrate-binding protein [Saprospiraceae bacterium]
MWPNKNTSLAFALVGLVLFGGCAKIAGTKSLKLAHGLPTDHPVHMGMVRMGELLAQKSGGRLTIEIYPSQQLGTERECLELLQIGSLGMTKVSSSVLENFAPEMKVFGLPYLFRDREHAYHVFDGKVGRELLLQTEKFWLRGLTYFDAGQRSFYTKTRPVHTPEDLSGLKIRVQESPVAMGMVRALGAAPTPISYGELYTALQQGIVDGAENNPPSFYTSHHYEVCKYYTLNEHTAVPDVLIISTLAWKRLTPQEQRWLQAAADEATVFQRKLWQEAEQQALDAVQKAGVEVIRPDKSLFMERTKGMLEEYKKDPVMRGLIESIQRTP